MMELTKMIAELRDELRRVNIVILSLEQLAQGEGKRRGRPPLWMSGPDGGGPKRRGRPPGSKNKPKQATDLPR